MAQHCPGICPVEGKFVLLCVVILEKQCLHEVGCEVADDQEGDNVPAGHLLHHGGIVGAASEAVDNHRGLNQRLEEEEHAGDHCIRVRVAIQALVDEGRHPDNDVEEERGKAEEEEEVVEKGDGMGVDLKAGHNVVSIDRGDYEGREHDYSQQVGDKLV